MDKEILNLDRDKLVYENMKLHHDTKKMGD